MPVRAFPPFPEDGNGFDFGEYWGDPVLVGAALLRLYVELQPAVCYCLSLHPVHDGESWFEPYGNNGLITDPSIVLTPTRIPYFRLLVEEEGEEKWPVLGQWVRGPHPSDHPEELDGAVWHGQIRLKSGTEYVGFFKAVIPTGTPPHDDKLRDAYRRVKIWLDAEVFARRQNDSLSKQEAREALASFHHCIKEDITAGRRKAALQRLATLLTSHLGTGFNRIICLAPTPDDTLNCAYAHGGDCSQLWSTDVQFTLANEVRTIPELQSRIELQIPPLSDPLYRDLAHNNPLSLVDISSSSDLIARIWRRGGSLEFAHHFSGGII